MLRHSANKRGMFFSIMVVTLIIFFIVSYRLNSAPKPDSRIKSVEYRVDSMNKFIKDVSYDFNRAVYIAGYRALLGINEYITMTGNFILEDNFREAIINGTINYHLLNISSKDNLNDWRDSIFLLSNDFMIYSEISFGEVRIYQESPWEVSFEVDASFYIRDFQNVSYYVFNKTGKGKVNIINFEDPLHSVFSNGTSISILNKTKFDNYELIYDGSNQTILNNLRELIISQNYVENPLAPNYIGRITGNLSGNKFGIESFVNPLKLEEEFVYSGSIVDYIYWSRNGSYEKINISGVSYLHLDDLHIDFYNLSNLIIS